MAGVALKMKRAAVHDMKMAKRIHVAMKMCSWRRCRVPRHRAMMPMLSARMNTIGPKEAKSIPRSGALASATVPKILVLVK